MTNNKKIIVIGEIEFSKTLLYQETIYKSPVWKYLLYNTYTKNLPFMSDTDPSYPSAGFTISNIIIDYEECHRAASILNCIDREKSFFQDGPVLYLHCKEHGIPLFSEPIHNGVLYGFTNTRPLRSGDSIFLPELLTAPLIEQSVDLEKNGRMIFNSGTFLLNNTRRLFDNILVAFGNEFNISVSYDDGNTIKRLIQYYISNYTTGIATAEFQVRDKREKLSFQVPNTFFSKEEYPFINENLDGHIIPDAYGYCHGVVGFCINEDQALSDDFRHFRFSRKLTQIDLVEAEIGKKWVTIWPTPSGSEVSCTFQPQLGMIDIPVLWAHDEGDPLKGINKIRATGIFNPEQNPGAIIIDLMQYYGASDYIDTDYDADEWSRELLELPEDYNIGIVLDKQRSGYEYIEEIQNKSLLNFQLYTKVNRYGVRLDYANRGESFNISNKDILNLNEIQVDYNAEQYATYTQIKYAYLWENGSSKVVEDKSLIDIIRQQHKWDKVYENESYLITQEQAKLKSQILLEGFRDIRPIIRGIKLWGVKWTDIVVYDIGFIDLSFTVDEIKELGPTPYQLLQFILNKEQDKVIKGLRLPSQNRTFAGKMRVQIIGHRIDLATGIIELDVRQKDKISIIPPHNRGRALYDIAIGEDLTGQRILFPTSYDPGIPLYKQAIQFVNGCSLVFDVNGTFYYISDNGTDTTIFNNGQEWIEFDFTFPNNSIVFTKNLSNSDWFLWTNCKFFMED
jgi:hypothetical protein